jgi:ferredoxin
VQVCPRENFEMVDDNGRIVSRFLETAECDHCAQCITWCGSAAVEVEPDGGTKVSIDKDKCTACEKCVLICPHVFEMVAEGRRIFARVKSGADMRAAGKCAFACPQGAIETSR